MIGRDTVPLGTPYSLLVTRYLAWESVMPGELNIVSTLSRPTVPVMNGPQLVYCLLEMRPAEAVSAAPMPLNPCLVLDHSGSMNGSKMDNLRDATNLVLDMLTPQDYIAIVA